MSEEIKNQQAAEPEALTETEINEQMQVRINKMHQIEEKGWKPFGHKFEWTHHAQDIADQFEELTANETVVRLSGRVMAIRGHGKTCFIDLMDKTGRIQLYVRKDALGEENYTLIKLMDIGDYRCSRHSFPYAYGRIVCKSGCFGTAFQISAASAGKMAWLERCRNALSSALC